MGATSFLRIIAWGLALQVSLEQGTLSGVEELADRIMRYVNKPS